MELHMDWRNLMVLSGLSELAWLSCVRDISVDGNGGEDCGDTWVLRVCRKLVILGLAQMELSNGDSSCCCGC